MYNVQCTMYNVQLCTNYNLSEKIMIMGSVQMPLLDCSFLYKYNNYTASRTVHEWSFVGQNRSRIIELIKCSSLY